MLRSVSNGPIDICLNWNLAILATGETSLIEIMKEPIWKLF
jgi:hypothetical protein